MSYRAVVVDLDGTLLNKKHTISSFTHETLKKLQEKSVPIIIATGRAFPDVLFRIKKWGLVGSYAISSNGARVYDPESNLIFSQDLEENVVSELLRMKVEGPADADGVKKPLMVSTNVFRDDQWVTDHGVERMLEAYGESGYSYKEVDLLKYPFDGVHQLCYLGYPEDLRCVEAEIQRRFEGKLEYNNSAANYLDVVPYGVTKGKALKSIADIMGIKLSEIVAFGDAMNDYTMLKDAGKGYLMGNASQQLRGLLPDMEVIGTNEEDGVAKKLSEIFCL